MEFIQIRKSTGEIVKQGKDIYPREDLAELEGQINPDYVWCIVRYPFERPEYDSRLFILNIIKPDPLEVDLFPADAEYPHMKRYDITYSTTKRSFEDIQIQLENAEIEANNTLVKYTEKDKLLVLGLGVLFRNMDGMTLNAKELVIKNRVIDRAVKLWKNDSNLKAKVDALAANQDIDIDEGWEKE